MAVQICQLPDIHENESDRWLIQHSHGASISEVLDWLEGPDNFSTNDYMELKSWNLQDLPDVFKVKNTEEEIKYTKNSKRENSDVTFRDEWYEDRDRSEHSNHCDSSKSKLPDISWFCERYNEEAEIAKYGENLIPYTVTEEMWSEDTNSSSSSLAFSSSSSEQCYSTIRNISPTSQTTISTQEELLVETSSSSSSSSLHNRGWILENLATSFSSSLSSVSLSSSSVAKTKEQSYFSTTASEQSPSTKTSIRHNEVVKTKLKDTKKVRKSGNNRGRKPGQRSNTKHLCDFMKTLLNDPSTNPSLVRWEDEKSRVFSIIQSKMVAQMWGTFKNNSKMNYENFGRAMRYCRKVGDFEKVPEPFKAKKKKLIFKFGPRAT